MGCGCNKMFVAKQSSDLSVQIKPNPSDLSDTHKNLLKQSKKRSIVMMKSIDVRSRAKFTADSSIENAWMQKPKNSWSFNEIKSSSESQCKSNGELQIERSNLLKVIQSPYMISFSNIDAFAEADEIGQDTSPEFRHFDDLKIAYTPSFQDGGFRLADMLPLNYESS